MLNATNASQETPPLVGTLPPHCRQDVETLRQFVRSVLDGGAPEKAVSPQDFREVLLTGATGFIGRFFLCDLLQRDTKFVVHCIVRADDVEHGRKRIRDALQQAEIWDESFDSRIKVVLGDICQPRFGLSVEQFDLLCRQVDAVYHLAADINLTSSYIDIRKNNTFSMRNVLELCLRIRFKHLFFASTMGVFPQYFCAFAHEFKDRRIDHQMQPNLESMKKTFPVGLLGYPWSKLTSEQILLFAQQAGMPLAIFRLPQISLSSSGFTPPHDLSVRTFAAAVDCEKLPEDFTFRSSNEAVDSLSRICTAISLNP
ncbi:MAG: NAD-dependent epimerase/dehydratase family protein, partial [Boseongicola sp. SB0662_bin_57]|nr:NAD-dependent epimerase/dehydratase family protein [Boseongicola sp. SB0662_bin_57]